MITEFADWESLRCTIYDALERKRNAENECCSREEYEECCNGIDSETADAIIENYKRYHDVISKVPREYSVYEIDEVRDFALKLNANWQRYIEVLRTSGTEAAKLDYVFNIYGQYLRDREQVYKGKSENHQKKADGPIIAKQLAESNILLWHNLEKAMCFKEFLEKVGRYKIKTCAVDYRYNKRKYSYIANYVYTKNGALVGILLNKGEFSKYMKGAWGIAIRKVAGPLKSEDVLLVLDTDGKIAIMNSNTVKFPKRDKLAIYLVALIQATSYQIWYSMICEEIEKVAGRLPIAKCRLIMSDKDFAFNSNMLDKEKRGLLKENKTEYIANKRSEIEEYGLCLDGRGWVNGEGEKAEG